MINKERDGPVCHCFVARQESLEGITRGLHADIHMLTRATKGDVKSTHMFHELGVQPVARCEAAYKKHALFKVMNASFCTEKDMN